MRRFPAVSLLLSTALAALLVVWLFGTHDASAGGPTPSTAPVAITKTFGDEDCGNDADSNDLKELLRFSAGLALFTQGCLPAINAVVQVQGTLRHWGDLNCDGAVNMGDPLTQLQVQAQADVSPPLPPVCPHIGDPVMVIP